MNIFKKILLRFLQLVVLYIPGARTLRVYIHRFRGVTIKDNVFIGTHVHIDSSYPERVYIGNNVEISIDVLLIAHFREIGKKEKYSIYIDDDVFIGPRVIIMPGVVIGKGSVVAAGSVVGNSVPPFTYVIGNPAVPKARVGKPLVRGTSYAEFVKNLRVL